MGKSTVSFKMSQMFLNMKQFSVRVHSERLMQINSPLGKFIWEHIHIGQDFYMPNEIVAEIFTSFLEQLLPEDFLLIEGYPINEKQNKEMIKILDSYNRKIDGIILLSLDERQLCERIEKRRICRTCEREHGAGIPMEDPDGKCPFCGRELEVRQDDSFDKLVERMANFKRESDLILNSYGEDFIRKINSTYREEALSCILNYLEEISCGKIHKRDAFKEKNNNL